MEANETCAVITVTLQPRSLVGLFAFRLGRLCAEPERRLLSNSFRPPGEVKWRGLWIDGQGLLMCVCM
ncbi:hypothetical protein KOW79_009651 [Hemibagrus wyckioides]|uniref:Uncharacterized protein n=1 Tax=Hemibagrus wyckioides TaxID=337641 RepID=A0A9D3NSF2_9TELE|nr:hypothetical protein KOW79_009651 [Hemibagrus wyckioides]